MIVKRLWLMLLAGGALSGSVAYGRDLGSIDPTSSTFRDDVWIGDEPRGTKAFLRPLWSGARNCADRLPSCVRTIRRIELLTSPAGDATANIVLDMTGHTVSVTGLVIIERVEASGFLSGLGIPTSWSVGGEKVLNPVGTHTWNMLVPDASPNAKWLPIQSYRFDDSSPAEVQRAPQPAAIPEASTSELIGVGFAALGWAAAARRRRV